MAALHRAACWLVQTEDFAGFDDMFSAEYAYFSSFSSTMMQHVKAYSQAKIFFM